MELAALATATRPNTASRCVVVAVVVERFALTLSPQPSNQQVVDRRLLRRRRRRPLSRSLARLIQLHPSGSTTAEFGATRTLLDWADKRVRRTRPHRSRHLYEKKESRPTRRSIDLRRPLWIALRRLRNSALGSAAADGRCCRRFRTQHPHIVRTGERNVHVIDD